MEYIDDKETVVKALARVLKIDGILSIAKHNRAGRVMQMLLCRGIEGLTVTHKKNILANQQGCFFVYNVYN